MWSTFSAKKKHAVHWGSWDHFDISMRFGSRCTKFGLITTQSNQRSRSHNSKRVRINEVSQNSQSTVCTDVISFPSREKGLDWSNIQYRLIWLAPDHSKTRSLDQICLSRRLNLGSYFRSVWNPRRESHCILVNVAQQIRKTRGPGRSACALENP